MWWAPFADGGVADADSCCHRPLDDLYCGEHADSEIERQAFACGQNPSREDEGRGHDVRDGPRDGDRYALPVF